MIGASLPIWHRDLRIAPGPGRGRGGPAPPRGAGEPPDEAEEPTPERLRRDDALAQAEPGGPAGEVVGHDLHGQPGPVGGEASRGQVVEAGAVLEVPDGVLDLGVANGVGPEGERVAVAIGDEG